MILIPDRLNMAQSIAAGRAWQRLHLAATAEGIAAQPLNQPVEMIDRHHMLGRQDEFGPSLAKLARASGWEPTSGSDTLCAKRHAHQGGLSPMS
jgi:hypothetical protein